MEKTVFTCIIVDDEQNSREVLKSLLQRYCPHIQVLGEAENVEDAYACINQLKPQVVFLDVQMPGGNGFSLLRKFTVVPFHVIFVTSYDEYAVEAIRFSALYYLMKPIEVPLLKEAVEKLSLVFEHAAVQHRQILNLFENEEKSGIEKKITVHSNDSVFFLPLHDIVFMEGMDEYTGIFMSNGEKYTSSKNLGRFEEMVAPYLQFIRINKSLIVNINYMEQYTKGEPCFITLKGPHTFEVSRRKKQEFLSRLH